MTFEADPMMYRPVHDHILGIQAPDLKGDFHKGSSENRETQRRLFKVLKR